MKELTTEIIYWLNKNGYSVYCFGYKEAEIKYILFTSTAVNQFCCLVNQKTYFDCGFLYCNQNTINIGCFMQCKKLDIDFMSRYSAQVEILINDYELPDKSDKTIIKWQESMNLVMLTSPTSFVIL